LDRIAPQYLVLNSILAAIAAIVLLLPDVEASWVWLLIGMISLFLFILDAEKTAEALRLGDAKMLVRYHYVYNVAVTLLLVDLAFLVIHRAKLGILFDLVVAAIALVIWYAGWGRDMRYLSHKANREALTASYEETLESPSNDRSANS
jgi:hypothetical protein